MFHAPLAQIVEHEICNFGVIGAIPIGGSIKNNTPTNFGGCLFFI